MSLNLSVRLHAVMYELASRGNAVFLGRGGHMLLRSFKLPEGQSSTGYARGFYCLLEQALALETNIAPETRVANLNAQRRAKWLLGRITELFVD